MSFRSVLDLVASVAMVAASGAILVALFTPVRPSRSAETPVRQGYAVGEALSGFPGLPTGGVVVLWLHSGCRYCEESMPFYRRLIDSVGTTKVIAMGSESESTLRGYLDKHGLGDTVVISVRPEQVKFYGTPTIAVLGPNGRVRGLWVGKLRDATAEDEVMSMASRVDTSEMSVTPDRHGGRPVLYAAGQHNLR